MNDTHDSAALAHYQSLIAERYPPDLAVALAAARYQLAVARYQLAVAAHEQASAVAVADQLALVRKTLVATQEQHPDLKRDVGRTVAAIDRKGTIKGRNNHRP